MTTIEKQNDLQTRKDALVHNGRKNSAGKLLARERIAKVFDEGSFVEIAAMLGTDGEGVVTGHGTIDGRLAYAYAQDFTVMSGAVGKLHAEKICNIMDMALKTGAPIIAILDSNGARISDGIEVISGYAKIYKMASLCSGVIPQISIIAGPCAGGASFAPALSDFVFYVKGQGKLFLHSPEMIESASGDKESVCPCENGTTHFEFESEDECFTAVKKVFSYLPSNNLCESENVVTDDINRVSAELNSIVPDNSDAPYDVKTVIEQIVDTASFIEVQKNYAKNIVIGLGRLNGNTVGIIANQPAEKDGKLNINACDKATRFINMCDAFNIPVVTLTDVPGFTICKCQEKLGVSNHAAALIYAYANATVPKVNVILRKAYGSAYAVMCSKEAGADIVYAWPTAEIAVMGIEGASEIMYNDEIAASSDPIKVREEMVNKYKEEYASPYIAAKCGSIDDVIEPDATRPMIISALEALATKRVTLPAKKHGNMPL